MRRDLDPAEYGRVAGGGPFYRPESRVRLRRRRVTPEQLVFRTCLIAGLVVYALDRLGVIS